MKYSNLNLSIVMIFQRQNQYVEYKTVGHVCTLQNPLSLFSFSTILVITFF